MEKLILFHGTPDEIVVPEYGKGQEKHDYGKGFYLTENIELAKEWAVCRPDEVNGWVHKYELDTEGLKIMDFQQKGALTWLAELMKTGPLTIPGGTVCLQESLSKSMAQIQMNMM